MLYSLLMVDLGSGPNECRIWPQGPGPKDLAPLVGYQMPYSLLMVDLGSGPNKCRIWPQGPGPKDLAPLVGYQMPYSLLMVDLGKNEFRNTFTGTHKDMDMLEAAAVAQTNKTLTDEADEEAEEGTVRELTAD
eukprot:gene19898-26601_t